MTLNEAITRLEKEFPMIPVKGEKLSEQGGPTGNYIHQLQMTIREQADRLREINECYLDLVRYLSSSKFHVDTTVQVKDVLNRLAPIRHATMGPEDKLVSRLTKPVVSTGEISEL